MFEKTYSEDKSFKPETQKKALENWSGKKLEEKINDLPELFEKLEENPELFSNFATLLKNSFKQEDFEFKFSHYLRPDIFRKSIEQIVSDKFKSFHRTGVPASFRFAWNREKLETQKREELIDCYVLAKNFKSQAGPNQKFIKDANHQPKFKKEVAAQAASDYIEFLDYLPELTQRTPDKYGILKRNWLFKIYGFVIDRANSIISQGNLSEEEARGISDDLIDKLSKMLKENKAFSQDHLFNFLDKTTNLIENLQKFYEEKIKFEDYEINKKMNEREISLLKSLVLKDEKVLEMGCGTGRLLLEMKKSGYDVSGLDFVQRHIDFIKKRDLKTNVFQADWHDTKLPDESQDVIYSLGRNILHDYSFIDQVQLFREVNRILKKGGKFIFDIPDREKGGYKEMVDEYKNEMEGRGIRKFRYGTIYDSPDGKNFATRYVYSPEDISLLTQTAGFKIIDVKKETLETGKGDKNLYYILEKI